MAFLIVILAVVFVLIAINTFVSYKVRKELEKLDQVVALSKLDFSIGKIRSNILSGTIVLKRVTVKSDPLFSEGYLSVNFPTIKMKGIRIAELMKTKNLLVRKLIFFDPEVELSGKLDKLLVKQEKQPTNNGLIEISIQKMDLIHGEFRIKNKKEGVSLSEILDFNLSVEGFTYVFDKKDDEKHSYDAISARLNDCSLLTPDGMYKILLDKCEIKNKESNVNASSIKIVPQYKKYEFSEKTGYQTDRIEGSISQVTIAGFSIEDLIGKNELRASKVSINDVSADIFRNKQLPPPANHFPPLPQQALRKMGVKLLIDSVKIRKSYIKYSEHVVGADEAGFIYFKDLNTLIVNLNNDPEYYQVDNQFSVYATGSLMGQSLFRARLYFPVISKSDTFFFSGSLEPMELKVLNSIAENNQNLRINSGMLNSLKFNGEGNADYAAGNLEFLYDNLDVTLLKQVDTSKKEHRFFSFLINKIIRTDNPPRGKRAFMAEMHFERDKTKSVLNFLWKTVLSGMTATVKPGRKNLKKENE